MTSNVSPAGPVPVSRYTHIPVSLWPPWIPQDVRVRHFVDSSVLAVGETARVGEVRLGSLAQSTFHTEASCHFKKYGTSVGYKDIRALLLVQVR